jgi:ketosteroid isomerase-like protein
VTDTPIAAVHQYIDAFNNGDLTGMAAVFAFPGSILDAFPPHSWQGPSAVQDWYRAVLADGEKHGASDVFVTLGDATRDDVTGDSAYVVVPSTVSFAVAGKQVTQSGAFFTAALRRLPEGWRIAAWAWSKGMQ